MVVLLHEKRTKVQFFSQTSKYFRWKISLYWGKYNYFYGKTCKYAFLFVPLCSNPSNHRLMNRLALLLIFVLQVVVSCAQQRITGIVLTDGDVPIIGARYQLQGGRVCRRILWCQTSVAALRDCLLRPFQPGCAVLLHTVWTQTGHSLLTIAVNPAALAWILLTINR